MSAARDLVADLSDLPIPAAERQRATRFRLDRTADVDVAATVSGRVAATALSTPDRTAVVTASGTVSYRELAGRTAAVMTFLAEAGAEPGAVVAVTGPRAAESIAVMLAVESFGAVYLPLDAGWPAARLATILRRSGARLVVDHHDGTAGSIAEAAAEAGVRLRALPGAHDGDPALLRDRCADPAEPRYVYYTSGTTGTPKGALVEHRGMINHLWAKIQDAGLTGDDVLAFTAPLTFDIAMWQMLAPLLLGGAVAVIDEGDMSFPRTTVKRLRAVGVTALELVPTMLAWLAEEAARGHGLPLLRCLLSTGEELQPTLAARLGAALPGVTIINVYGFTETSDDVTHHVVRAADLAGPRLPVGSPVANTALYVLVEDNGSWRAAAPGEPGELFVGGLPPGIGYLGDERATAAAFFRDVLDPASPTGRLYKTGDAAVVEDGLLWYLGRLDRQVKVSGVRMELGEIEARLKSHPGLANGAVVTTGDGDTRELVAFYVSAGATVTPEALRTHLAATLPPAMVPRRWHAVAALPVNANGKVDHKALAATAAAAG